MYTVSILGEEIYLAVILLPVMILFSIISWFVNKEGDPKPGWLYVVISALMSVIWIYLQANIVMDFMVFIQYISGFSQVLISMTLLSLGNSLGDLFVDTALAKKGYGVMAITGIFSGQLLNLLIGFALNCLYSSLK